VGGLLRWGGAGVPAGHEPISGTEAGATHCHFFDRALVYKSTALPLNHDPGSQVVVYAYLKRMEPILEVVT
jgi:hypothetical protein